MLEENAFLVADSFPKHEKYKSSGVDWLGEVPEHWSRFRLKQFLTATKKLVGDDWFRYDLLSLTLNGVILRDMENPEGKFPSDFSSYQVVKPGQIILCLFDVEETPRTVGLSSHQGMITGAYDVFDLEGLNPRFFYYWYLSLDQNKKLKALYRGLRNTIPTPRLQGMEIFLPDSNQQQCIVGFLDTKTKEIEEAIKQKQRTIALLEEYKHSLIERAVTKGLDPSVPMKDSGVDWLGEVPAHWHLKKGKWLFNYQQDNLTDGDEIITCFRDGEVTLRRNRRIVGFTNALQEIGYQHIDKGDLVIHGMDAFAGAIGVSDASGKSTPVYVVVKAINGEVSLTFSAYLLRYFAKIEFILSLASGIRQRSSDFRWSNLKEILLLTPPISEQIQIVNFLDTKTKEIEEAKFGIQTQIDHLKEYKDSLIESAVTGKIKVA